MVLQLILSFIIPLVAVGIGWLIEYMKYKRWCRIHDAKHEAEMEVIKRRMNDWPIDTGRPLKTLEELEAPKD